MSFAKSFISTGKQVMQMRRLLIKNIQRGSFEVKMETSKSKEGSHIMTDNPIS